MLDRQETFDRVLDHLRKQGEPAVNNMGFCRYRTEDGRKCAIGALIPDELYQAGIENHTAEAPIVIDKIPGAAVWEDGAYLKALQKIHDEAERDGGSEEFLSFVEEYARRFADEHELEYDAPESVR